jgi:hypothetical protein
MPRILLLHLRSHLLRHEEEASDVLLSQFEPWRSKKGRDQRRGVGNRATWLPKNPLGAAFGSDFLLREGQKRGP